jgi:gas vesicle protein
MLKITSFVIGIGAGAAIALLCAPRSGEETRELLSKKARDTRRYAERRARDLRDMASDRVAEMRDMALDQADQLKDAANAQVRKVRDLANDAAQFGLDVVDRQRNAVSEAVQAAKETYTKEMQAKPS